MKKSILSILTIICVLAATVVPVMAAPGTNDWNVIQGKQGLYAKYNSAGKWETNLDSEWDDPLDDLEPGDKIELTVSLINDYTGETLWYMENRVIKTLEQLTSNSNTHGGGYTYTLEYTDPQGKTESLFDSDVGGEGNVIGSGTSQREGLLEATNNLEDYFYLDTFKAGQKGSVKLTVALDGESQGNWYQDTKAQLQLRFGVEKEKSEEEVKKKTVTKTKTVTTAGKKVYKTATSNVKTGDPFKMIPYIICMGISGIIILLIAVYLVKNRRRERNGG